MNFLKFFLNITLINQFIILYVSLKLQKLGVYNLSTKEEIQEAIREKTERELELKSKERKEKEIGFKKFRFNESYKFNKNIFRFGLLEKTHIRLCTVESEHYQDLIYKEASEEPVFTWKCEFLKVLPELEYPLNNLKDKGIVFSIKDASYIIQEYKLPVVEGWEVVDFEEKDLLIIWKL